MIFFLLLFFFFFGGGGLRARRIKVEGKECEFVTLSALKKVVQKHEHNYCENKT